MLQEEELETEEDEPDRLTLLLPQSKFDCTSKKTGYYADDGLNCEVFHYCQDNARHSWICPEGFVFHQVCRYPVTVSGSATDASKCFVVGRSRVQISTRRPAILTCFVQANAT